uniref:Uncharacterized protein n=1 Tax=Anguilla anguilla TaxID=7936 RepID=A0A0E9S5A9_ANGAN
MKQEFEFNISASIHFDTQLDSSQFSTTGGPGNHGRGLRGP